MECRLPSKVKHTFLVTPQSLQHFADTGEDVRGSIPELLFRLLATSVRDAAERRVPFGRDINQPGVDGFLETPTGFGEFVPTGKSFWEIGTGKDSRAKANADYKTRTESKDVPNKGEFALVLVTPRTRAEGWTETEQKEWVEAKRAEGPWRDIRVIDGTKICHWLAFNPSIDAWLAERMRIVRGPITSPVTHWENIQSRGEQPLTPEVFLIGRDNAKKDVLRVLTGELRELRLQTLQPREAVDFVVATLASEDPVEGASLSGRTLLVEDAGVWKDLCELQDSHLLIPHGALDIADQGGDLLALALRKGHRVIFPTPRAVFGKHISTPLKSPKKFELKSALARAGFTEPRSRHLSEHAAGSPTRLLRILDGLPETPDWAKGENAVMLAPAMLAGSWSEHSEEEKQILATLFGRDYADWSARAPEFCVIKDPPLQNRGSLWRFTSIFEAWHLLGPLVSSNNLKSLEKVALQVLGERDPAFDLSPAERWTAPIREGHRKYSSQLREGLAEALALLAAHPETLTRLPPQAAKQTVDNVVRRLLDGADRSLWGSLGNVLPLLAEAAPVFFLKAVNLALDANPSPIAALFSEERPGVTGGNYLTNLWWSLEALAWGEDHLLEVVMVLSRCAEIDPGGTWANRPSNSLVDIFLPWHPQTCASIEKRVEVVTAVVQAYPRTGWQLLLALLPRFHGSTTGTYKPEWREFIPPEWQDGATVQEYWQQVESYSDLAVEIARVDPNRLLELIQRIPDLTPPTRERILSRLRSDAVRTLDDASKLPLWDALLDLVTKHRKFHDADWAMPAAEVAKVELAAGAIAPQSSFVRHQRLFTDHDFDLYEEKGDYDGQREALEALRGVALGEVLAEGGIELVLRFAQVVQSPRKVGFSLARHGSSDLDAEILPILLTGDRGPLDLFTRSYVVSRFFQHRFTWADSISLKDWSAKQKGLFFSVLPFDSETWQRVDKHLDPEPAAYWSIAEANALGVPDHLTFAIEKLLEHGRPDAALRCLEFTILNKKPIPSALTLRTLEALLDFKDLPRSLDFHYIASVFEALQNDPSTDRDTLMKMEWAYLPILDRYSGARPKTLERRLADDPSFFCQVLRAVFRSDKDTEKREPSDQEKKTANAAYNLLRAWHALPGGRDDGSVNSDDLRNWLLEVMRSCEESGHRGIALSQVGRVLAYHGSDPDGLWLPRPVAAILDESDHETMRRAFIIEKQNQRGVYTWTAGREEKEIANRYTAQAEAVEKGGFRNLGSAMRDLARWYEEDAEREAASDPYADW